MAVRLTSCRSGWALPATKHATSRSRNGGGLAAPVLVYQAFLGSGGYLYDGSLSLLTSHVFTMQGDELRALQAPLKQAYRTNPEKALVTLSASGSLDPSGVSCRVETGRAVVEAGLHPATGGTGLQACSGDMLLEALAACAGVTLRAVATALEIPVRSGTVHAEGDLDFRGTLGVSKEVPVGFQAIRLRLDLDTDATREQLDTLLKLTERYCVVLQTLRSATTVTASLLP